MPKAKKPSNADEIKDHSQNKSNDADEDSEEDEDHRQSTSRPEVFDANSYLEQRIHELHREKREDIEHAASKQLRRAVNRGGSKKRGKRYTITSSTGPSKINSNGNSSSSEDEKGDDTRGMKMKRASSKLPPVGSNSNSVQNKKKSPPARRSKRRKQRFQTRLATISD